MDIIEDFRDRILGEVNHALADSIILKWASCNDLIARPETQKKVKRPDFSIRNYRKETNTRIVLITHPDMKKVWSKANVFIHKTPDNHDALFWKSNEYVRAIISALSGGTYWEKLPPAQRCSEYDELVESLKGVAAALNKVGYHEPALGMMDEETYSDLQFNFFGQWRELTRNDSSFFYKIPELLNRYADTLQAEQRHKRALIDRPNGDDALVTYFSRSLYTSHKHFFGTPLYGAISTIAGIFYPDHDTSSEKIRSSIRAMR